MPDQVEDKVLGFMEAEEYNSGFGELVYIFVTSTRLIITHPIDTESKKETFQDVLKDVGVHFVVEEFILRGLGSSISQKLKNSQTHKIMDKYRTSLKESLDKISPQRILESDKDGSEIIDIAIKEVEMKRWRVRWLGYFDAEIKIITEMKGKKKELYYKILPPSDGFPDLKKRPLTDQEFSQYVEIVRSLVGERLKVIL